MMKIRTKFEVRRRRPRMYTRRDASYMLAWFCWKVARLGVVVVPGRTDAEEEESEKGDGMAA
jgi:hypothetical protein